MRRVSEPSEKRVDPRVPLVLCIDHPGAPARHDTTENLSRGGLFVRTDRPLRPGERVPLELSFPGLLEPLRIEVEVVWRRHATSGLPAGVAVKVPADRLEDRDALERLAGAAGLQGVGSRVYTILLVDDNHLVQAMYEHALARLRSEDGSGDIAVEAARDGDEALERLRRAPPIDLVISDVYAPALDGFVLVERMHAEAALTRIPVLVISSGSEEARARAAALGVDVYLEKPVRIEAILGTVRALLRVAL